MPAQFGYDIPKRKDEEGWEPIPQNDEGWEPVPPEEPKSERGPIGKAWDFINTPITSYVPDSIRHGIRAGLAVNPFRDYALGKLGLNESAQQGVAEGIANIGESFTSPLSLATMGAAGAIAKVPKIAGLLGGTFAGLAGYNLSQRPSELRESTGPQDTARILTESLGDVGMLAGGALGARKAWKQLPGRKVAGPSQELPPVLDEIKYPPGEGAPPNLTDVFYANEVNTPLPRPWLAQDPSGKYLVKNNVVDLEIKAKAPQLETASQNVKREFLQQRQLEVGDDVIRQETPEPSNFDRGLETIAEPTNITEFSKLGGKPARSLTYLETMPEVSKLMEQPVKQTTVVEEPIVEPSINPVADELHKQGSGKLYSGLSAIPEVAKSMRNTWEDLRKTFGSFVPQSVKELVKERPFGLTVGNNGDVSKQSLLSRLPKYINGDELAALKANGLETFISSFKGDKMNVNDLANWIKENGPRVEVKKLSAESKTNPERQERASLQHLADSLGLHLYEFEPGKPSIHIDSVGKTIKLNDKSNLAHHLSGELRADPQLLNKLDRLYELQSKKLGEDVSPNADSATANYQFVNPKPLDQMPGAVDILVRKPLPNIDPLEANSRYTRGEITNEERIRQQGIQHEGQHFGSSDENILGWTRGYMEILPNGEKVFHVFEVQSDWGQTLRDTKERLAERIDKTGEGSVSVDLLKTKVNNLETPELNHYQSLALKAAIEHAHQQGAKYIALSDAETAMITQGHDAVASEVKPLTTQNVSNQYPYTKDALFGADWQQGKYVQFKGDVYRVDAPEKMLQASIQAKEIARELQPYAEGGNYIPQEKGMRLNYDKILPDTLRKITGSEPVRVEFGVHQNAAKARDNLIFKDAQGSPKTSSSARMYAIDKLVPRLDIKEPFQIYNTLYSGIPLEAFGKAIKNTFNDLVSKESREKLARLGEDMSEFASAKLRSSLSQISNLGPTGKYLSNVLDKFFVNQREYYGQYVNGALQILKDSKLDNRSFDRVMKYAHNERYGLPQDTKLDIREHRLLSDVRKFLVGVHDEQRKLGILVDGVRKAMDNPKYWPGITDPKVLDTITRKYNSPEAIKLRQDWIEHAVQQSGGKLSKMEAASVLNEYIKSLGHGGEASNKFAAIRRAEGYGVPWSWQDKHLPRLLERYGRRVSKDFSHFINLESDPKARGILGIADQFGSTKNNATTLDGKTPIDPIKSHPEVEDTLRRINQDFSRVDVNLEALGRVIKAGMIQAATGVINYAQNFNKAMPYLKASQLDLYIKAHKNTTQGLKDALKEGVARVNPAELANPQIGYNTFADAMTSISNWAWDSILFGKPAAIENFTRALDMNLGKLITLAHMGDAVAKGDKQSIHVLDTLVKHAHVEDWRTLTKSLPNVPEKWLNKVAAAFVERVQQTYDPRDSASWTLNSKLSPIMSLSRWAFGAANTLHEDVILPMKKGNYTPLLNYLVASGVVGSTVIPMLQQVLSGRRPTDPTLKEAVLSGNTKEIAVSLVNLANYASMGGIVSTLIKSAVDIGVTGKMPRGFTFPALEFFTHTLVERAAQAREAIANGEPVDKVLSMYVLKAIQENVQTLRIIANHTLERENVKHSNKVRDYEVFKRLDGQPTSFSPPSYNPFEGSDTKKFKRATINDVEELPQLAGKAINSVISKNENDPIRLSTALKGLKQMPITWSPSVESNGPEFVKYIEWLRRTKGDQYAEQFIQQYLTQKTLNKAKGNFIPQVSVK